MTLSKHDSLRFMDCQSHRVTILLFLLFIPSLFIVTYSLETGDRNDLLEKPRDDFQENLFIKPLIDGKLFVHFQFKTVYRKDFRSLRWENKFEIFPLSLADLVATSDFSKLHFSLTKGNWNYRNWGYPTRSSSPGAQIKVKFSQNNENPERSWTRLINSLAGKFCASLSSAGKKTITRDKQRIYYANLPEETLCTENLTPWKKLLPCYSNSGLASLLNAVNLLKSSYSSLAIDIEPVPRTLNGEIVVGHEQVQSTQSMIVVFNPLLLFEGKQTWSLTKIFGNPISKQCSLASKSRIHVDITGLDDKSHLYPSTFNKHDLNIKLDNNFIETRTYATFDLNLLSGNSTTKQQLNLGIKQNHLFKPPPVSSRNNIPISFKTHIADYGSTIVATITNNHGKAIRVTYMDVVPHYIRVYLHTLMIRTKSGQELKPDKQDSNPTLIDLSFIVPASTEVQISYEFERTFLRWTEYKPDANKGVLMGSAMISISLCEGLNHLVFPISSVASNVSSLACGSSEEQEVMKLYAKPLLIILPTPDFSMPYNVITLVCTALVALFGAIHGATTRPPVIKFSKKSDEETKKDK